MRLIEADGKLLLRRRGLPVPNGRRYAEGDAIEPVPGGAAIKTQLFTGARGKGGLVQIADEPAISTVAATVLARMRDIGATPHILVEEKVEIETEYYLAWRIDDVRQAPVMLFATQGGIDVESNADAIREFVWDPLRPLYPHHLVQFLIEAGAAKRPLGAIARFAADLYRLFVAEDAELLEINPLAITPKGQVIALDAKVVLDDNARSRHRDWNELLSARLERAAMSPLEVRARKHGLTLVDLDGCVALFAGGAGFGMALVDILADAGVPAANFADASGGSSPEAFATMGDVILERAADPAVKAIVCFQTMGATSLKTAVDGLLSACDRATHKKPLVVGFAVSATSAREMSAEEARRLFAARGHHVIHDLDELIPTLKRLIAS